MASTIIDSAIFQGLFSCDAMRAVWSDENRTQKYLEIEAALAKVQGRLGLIPKDAADEIVGHCRLEQIDMVKLRAHPLGDLRGAPARRGADGRDGRRRRTLHRPVGDRMDRAARGVLPDGRRAQAVAFHP